MTGDHRPRLGFAGLGWIGRHRLAAIVEARVADVVALADPDAAALAAAAEHAPHAARCTSTDALLRRDLDGLVVATPNAQHAPQCLAALERGLAVFCQKPLARTTTEVRAIVDAAARADRLLAVDFSYRHTQALARVRDLVRDGTLGDIFAIDLVFHNAYGPDKAWFDDMASAGGGCLMDLGVHLVDFLHWTFDRRICRTRSYRYRRGLRLASDDADAVEDFAAADLELEGGAIARLACSWRLPAGQDARIEIAVFGSAGSAVFRNVNGSFYDFVGEHCVGTQATRLCGPPDAWGGRAAVAWADRLAGQGPGFDPSIVRVIDVATTIDRLYGRGC